nr:hypothetical protein [Tanacetum cinerariifolium]
MTDIITDIITELLVKESLEKDVPNFNSSLTKTNINCDSISDLSKKLFKELKYNAFSGMEEEDVVGHIANFLGILNLIKTVIFNTDRLRMNIFPLSLIEVASVWWLSEGKNKITAWGILVGRQDDKRIDRMTKSALCHTWVDGYGNAESTDDIVSSDEEWEESDYGNPPDTKTDSFFKPYLDAQENNDIEKGDERSLKKCKVNTCELENIILNKVPNFDNIKNQELKERVCKAKKFKVIKYLLGPNEEYIAITITNTMLGKGTKIVCLKSTKIFLEEGTKCGP